MSRENIIKRVAWHRLCFQYWCKRKYNNNVPEISSLISPLIFLMQHHHHHLRLCSLSKYGYFCTFEAIGTQIFSVFLPFCSKGSKQTVCAWQKWKRAELQAIRTNLFTVFVMYALDSAHKKVPRMKRSRPFAFLLDKPGRIEQQVDPITNLPSLTDSNVKLDMCQSNLIIRFGTCKVQLKHTL